MKPDSFFSDDERDDEVQVKNPDRSRKVKPKLPDLPKNILLLMGYTDFVPNPDAGEYVYGGKW